MRSKSVGRWAVSLGSVFGQVFGVWQKELQAGQ
jgi:hypothetical protein